MSNAAILSADVSIDIPRLPSAEPQRKLTWFHAGAGAFAALVLFASVITWNWSESMSRRNGTNGPLLASGNIADVRAEVARMLAASKDDDFFGIPIGGTSTSIVIDDRDDMQGYTSDVAHLAYAALQNANTTGGTMSVVEARLSNDGNGDDPYYAMPVLRIQSVRKRVDDPDKAEPVFAPAIELAAQSSPNQIFVVFASPLTADEMSRLDAAIRETRVPVNVVALGNGASQSYSALADINGGKFIPVTDAQLQQLVNRCAVDMPPRVK